MKKEDFDRRIRDIKILLDAYYKGEKEIAYVLLLQVEDEEEKGMSRSSILSNVNPSKIVQFVLSIMRAIGSLIGRQN